MKFIRIRLHGEALNIARSEMFETLKKPTEFFGKMFGSAKTHYDLTGELAEIKQVRSETVVLYLNRLKEIEKEIRKAAEKEGRITNESTFDTESSKDCLKHFMRGLRWEIKARMGTPATYQKAQEEVIETEREFACSVFEDPTEKD